MNAADIFNKIKNDEVDIDSLIYPGRHLADVGIDQLTIDLIPCGFPTLDRFMFLKKLRSELIIVGGRPSMGKSSLMFQIAFNVATTSPVHVFSLEMDHEQISTRLLANMSGCSISDIQRGTANRQALFEAHEKLKDLKYIIDDRGGMDVNQLCDAARQRAANDGTELIIIDYLQMMRTERGHSKDDEIGMITRSLKELAKELKVPIILGSQLNRQNEMRGLQYGDYKPILSDLRDSGNIEQDADLILFVHRESRYKDVRHGEADIIISKNRNGACGEVTMNFIASQTKFLDRNT